MRFRTESAETYLSKHTPDGSSFGHMETTFLFFTPVAGSIFGPLSQTHIEIWGCSFVSELKLWSTSSAQKFFANEITWIT